VNYDPAKNHRRSIRLKGYDYSQPGAYFITICIQQRECLLGEITGEDMQLNDAGRMVERWWVELTNKFPAAEIDEYIVMPNHFHGIVVIIGDPSGIPPDTPLNRPTLADTMDWFKTMTTNEYIRGVKECGWPPFWGRFWQRGYYDHIIRDEDELNRVRQYIILNPARWAQDRQNPIVEQGPEPEMGSPGEH